MTTPTATLAPTAATNAAETPQAASTAPSEPPSRLSVAYFSMEIGLDPNVPTYAGGLGILAGDSIRAAADMGIRMAGITLLHREGYFFQKLLPDGWQVEDAAQWDPIEHMTVVPEHAEIVLEGRTVRVGAWRYDVRGVGGHVVPVYLLDTDLPENSEQDRQITRKLYLSDPAGRLAQEAVLGVGGVRLLRAMGYDTIDRCHMNEGHAALLVLELLREESRRSGLPTNDPRVLDRVRQRGVFTTHTPVAAGHDRFTLELVRSMLEPALVGPLEVATPLMQACEGELLNMTALGFALSAAINAVAQRHGEVSRALFPGHRISAITNGVHAATWVSTPFADLYDRRIPSWRQDGFALRAAHGIALDEIARVHRRAKRSLVDLVNWRDNVGFDPQTFTIGFARRATGYKRAELLVSDIVRLKRIAAEVGRIQIVFAGKSHPNDTGGKEMIKRIFTKFAELRPEISAVYLPNYDMALAQTLIPGVDLWLNTPQPPLEASGTSGMKAALNGVPSLSTLDGWWLEGCIEGVTGWAIGGDDWHPTTTVDTHAATDTARDSDDATAMYGKLEHVIVPMFYNRPEAYLLVMRNAIAVNGAYFTTQRMMMEYVTRAYVG